MTTNCYNTTIENCMILTSHGESLFPKSPGEKGRERRCLYMTPRKTVMWIIAVVIIFGVLTAVIPYWFTNDVASAIPGFGITAIGLVIGLIVTKIRWS